MLSQTKEHNEEVLPDVDIKDQDYDPEKHEFISYLPATKACVTPLKTGLTIPCSELSRLLLFQ